MVNFKLYENFIESIAVVLSKALTNDEREKIAKNFQSFNERLRQLSSDNLKRIKQEAEIKRPYCKHKLTCTQSCIRSFLKSFCTTYILKYALGFIPTLMTGKIFRNPRLILLLGGRDTTQLSLFLSSFTFLYKVLLCSLRRIFVSNDWKISFIAGLVASTSLAIDRNDTRRLMIALYLSTRNLHFISRHLWRIHVEPRWDPNDDSQNEVKEEKTKPKYLISSPRIPGEVRKYGEEINPFSFEFSSKIPKSLETKDSKKVETVVTTRKLDNKIDIIRKFVRKCAAVSLMMISSGQIAYGFVLHPETLNSSYFSFLLLHGNFKKKEPLRAKNYLNAWTNVITNIATNNLSPLYNEYKIPPELKEFKENLGMTKSGMLMCSLQHGNHYYCSGGALSIFKSEILRAVALYAPLNFFMTVVFKIDKFVKDPKNTLLIVTKSILRSTLFLASYVTVAFSSVCYFRRIFGGDKIWMYYVNGFLAGSTVLLEAPGRRLELALYCFPRALESFFNCGVKKGWFRNIKNGELIYFGLSMATMMTLYQHDPESIHDGYR
ncbi:hypothetical protein HK099_004887 [Clydaea vesicula]|uniref:Transmembrane protein 135 N-terminal domain-containing protein n=1 Tax=Clydaea vesicula TaxID=447962 RepID=A0AAD5U6S9_9FUNG|nr:hypothetical protein HK099_004887 [Clydaea vesicula]